MEIFEQYSRYYDLLYKHKDYPAEVNYIINLIKKYEAFPTKSLVDFGSGTGKHARIFADSGYTVLGIEPSSEMLTIARTLSDKNLTFEKGDTINIPPFEKKDVALALFHVISYVTTNENLLKTFSQINSSLNEKALFIFDFWYSPAVISQVPENRIKNLENDEIEIRRLATPEIHWNENIVDVNYDVKITFKNSRKNLTFSEKHRMRHFSLPEIEMIASQTGFKLVAKEEFLTGNIPGPNTWGVCVVLQKK